jgi:hypothetical protein
MPGNAAIHWSDLVTSVGEQRRRLGMGTWAERWARALASGVAGFRQNPRRDLDASLSIIASYLEPTDVLLEIGGGAGRYGLPLALRCRELINIEPVARMGEEFAESARDGRVANARWLHSEWPTSAAVEADVTLVTNVVSFVADIVPFIEHLVRASRRRVMIVGSTYPFWDESSDVFHAAHGELSARLPEYRELLPVIWEMGIVPDVRVLGPTEAGVRTSRVFPTRDEAVEFYLRLVEAHGDQARRNIDGAFDDLFLSVDGGFRRPPGPQPRVILTTWETRT